MYGNYAGDNLNFDMAEEMLADERIQTAHVRVWDDCASAPKERIEDRRGIAGDVFVIKIAGAACDAGLNLDEAVRVTEKARNSTCSIGVATSPGQIQVQSSLHFSWVRMKLNMEWASMVTGNQNAQNFSLLMSLFG